MVVLVAVSHFLLWYLVRSSKHPPNAISFNQIFAKRGFILFDDYGWRGHEDTRKTIDKFIETTKGTLLPMPIGQAIYFKLD